MYFIVAFSSSLDVAAIQMELGRNLDFNHELQTVGLCNLISGLTGGFTGSCTGFRHHSLSQVQGPVGITRPNRADLQIFFLRRFSL